MRLAVLTVIGLITMTACTASPLLDENPTHPSAGYRPTTTITPASTTTSSSTGPVRGALPDGTIYDIAFPTGRQEDVVEIRAGLVIEVDGSDVPVTTEFTRREPGAGRGGTHDLEVGDWTVTIGIPPELDDDARRLVEDSIEPSTEVAMPVLSVEPPLRWSGPRQVVYETFFVRSGCDVAAVACNATHAVSVVPAQGARLETPISVQSYSLRPPSDPNYLRPGPSRARWSPDVLWTGAEMVVWGGSASPGPPSRVDGVAYDPVSGDWRQLSRPPLSDEQSTRAVWTGDEMVVLAEEATVAWEPTQDRWRVVADGIVPPIDPGMTLMHASAVVTWTDDGPYRLEPNGIWEPMATPGVGEPGPGGSVLRTAGSRLWAIGQDGCDRLVAQWLGGRWDKPERIPMDGSPPRCGHPGQTAVVDEILVLWDDTSGEVVAYEPDTGVVSELPAFPLPEVEHAPGPVHLERGFLVTAALDGAIFDSADMRWTRVELPGLGTDADMVWTGEEVLMWGKCCYGPDDVDAWRWVPPAR